MSAYKHTTNAEELNKVLQRDIFTNLPFDPKLNLTEKWSMETENGEAYIKENGMRIVCKCLNAFRHKPLPRCKFAHRDMRCDILGVPMVDGWQIALLDQCCNINTCTPELIQTCVYNDILTRDCYEFIYDLTPETKTPILNSPDDATDNETVQVPLKAGNKRRKKT